jgi:hypothetical protein
LDGVIGHLRIWKASSSSHPRSGRPKAMPLSYAEIKRQLESMPLIVGESRDHPERVLIVGKFAVFYEVFESSATVMVYRVHYRGYPKIDV